MKQVRIYTTSYCPYCHAAKALLDAEGIVYEEISANAPEIREQLVKWTGRRTVPQIFFDDMPIGGYDDLNALHRAGELPKMLAQVY